MTLILEKFIFPLNPLEQQIVDHVEPLLLQHATDIAYIRLSAAPELMLVLFIEKISIQDVAHITRWLIRFLAILNNKYNWFNKSCRIEISSPGLNRPLTKKTHFLKAVNTFVKIITNLKILYGFLLESNDLGIKISDHPGIIFWHNIKSANVVYTGN